MIARHLRVRGIQDEPAHLAFRAGIAGLFSPARRDRRCHARLSRALAAYTISWSHRCAPSLEPLLSAPPTGRTMVDEPRPFRIRRAWPYYVLAAVAFVIVILLLGNRKFPPAPVLLVLGAAFALTLGGAASSAFAAIGVHAPVVHVPAAADMWQGFLLLALPQIPLSLGNSVLATKLVAADLFPERPPLTIKKIGFTYAGMNIISALFSGVPVCHGSGGMAGHYTFGARTGGSVIIAGLGLLTIGVLFGGSFGEVALIFPKPMLGVLLLFEGVAMLALMRDLVPVPREFALALFLGVVASGLPYGYLVALVVGTVLARTQRRVTLT